MPRSSDMPAPRDPVAAVTHTDPYPYYEALATREGLWFDAPSNLRVASSPHAVRSVLAHSRMLVRPPGEPVPRHLAGSAAGELFGALIRMNDGERHAALKEVLGNVLGALPVGSAAFAAAAQRIAAECAAELALARSATAIDAWVRYTPATVVARLVGFGDDGAAGVARDAEAFVAGFAPPADAALAKAQHDANLSRHASAAERAGTHAVDAGGRSVDGARLDAAATAAAALLRAAGTLAGSPPPDSLAALIAPAAARAGADPMRIAANLVGLVTQTFEATSGLLGNSLVALAKVATAQPARFSAFAGDGRSMREFVAEVSRADPSVHNTRRFAAGDLDVLGTRLPAGAPVLVVLAAANRRGNETAYRTDGATGVPTGAPGHADGDPHHEFGAGRHACPGRDLAQSTVCHALRALLQSGFDVASLPPSVTYRPSPNARMPIFFPGSQR